MADPMSGVRKLLSSMWTGEEKAGGGRQETPPKHTPLKSHRLSLSPARKPQNKPTADPLVTNLVLCPGSSVEQPSSRGSTPSSDSNSPPEAATGAANLPHESHPPRQLTPPLQQTNANDEAKKAATPTMRRNYTASAALSQHGVHGLFSTSPAAEAPAEAGSPGMRRNTSAATLCELRRREQLAMSKSADASLQGSRAAVVEAVACRMLEHILGADSALAAMRVALAKSAAAGTDAAAANGLAANGGEGGAASSSYSVADDEARLAAMGVPDGISASLQGYILTIVRHLELPNSCIVAALIYVQRAVSGSRFALSITNWQPCLLAAFVIAAKLSFDEPVWNEDFVKALRISNVQVHTRLLPDAHALSASYAFTPLLTPSPPFSILLRRSARSRAGRPTSSSSSPSTPT